MTTRDANQMFHTEGGAWHDDHGQPAPFPATFWAPNGTINPTRRPAGADEPIRPPAPSEPPF